MVSNGFDKVGNVHYDGYSNSYQYTCGGFGGTLG